MDELQGQIDKSETGFIEAMDDDFNTGGALGNLFDLVRNINKARDEGAADEEMAPAQDMLQKLAGVLGLQLNEKEEGDQSAAPFIDLLVELRTEIRKEKLYALSDQIRDRLAELGVTLEDSKQGTTWHF